jgi:hypothetical protein
MLTVITHTKNERPELLERCKASVAAALPDGAQHLIIECPDRATWNKRRVSDAIDHDIVAFVDDDDYISKDSLTLCLEALDKTGLAAVCTNEVIVDIDEKIIGKGMGRKTYLDATVHPRVVHHLCILRGKLIDPKAVEFNNRFGVGIDWFIRQSVVQQHGCVHVPIDGYFWTQHPGQHTIHTRNLYMESMREMQSLIRETWPAKFKGAMPIYG